MDQTNLFHIIDRFAGLRVLVIGEAMLDVYHKGKTERLCREAPVPVVALNESLYVPGGAANCAVNVASLGAEAVFLSVVGDDLEGTILRRALEERGVSTGRVLPAASRRTLVKSRVLAASQMLLRFDQGSVEPLDAGMEETLIENLVELYPECDAVILSDYGYGIFTPRLLEVLARFQVADEKIFVADSKNLKLFRPLQVTAVKPNFSEAVHMLGLDPAREGEERAGLIAAHGQEILRLTGAQVAAVTLDTEGALVFERDCSPYRTYARPAPHSQAAGAGDTFVAALALSLASGAYTHTASELASAAASIVVGKDNTAACYVDELRAHFFTDEKYISDAFGLAARFSAYRQKGLRVVFTNGCFDILHRGHITYLNKAKSLGDILVVGINADASVRRLKGSGRPINSLEDRVQVLAALSCIDHIIAFEADTPHDLIRLVQPDVFVKGGDYRRETLPEAPLVEQLGGEVVILPYLEDRSTTSIIERIRHVYTWPSEERLRRVEKK